MLRWGVLIVGLGLVAWFAAAFAEFPGTVTLTWMDWRLDAPLGVLAAAALVLAAIAALLYRLWSEVLRAPRVMKRYRQDRRQRLGFEALSRGLVAVAAGDAEAARRQARRAQTLLDGQPLTMLLSAQAAQLQGDEPSASRFFAAMRERGETEFLGVRGLLAQAIRREDYDEALRLADRAYRINPKSEWAVATLYDLQKRTGHWTEAQAMLQRDTARQVVGQDELSRERADLLLRQSEEQPADTALTLAKRAYDSDPAYPPATVRYARLLIGAGRHHRAARSIERTWARNPDPELAALYAEAQQAHDAMTKVKAAKQLAATNPDHLESRIAVAMAALEARLWGVARSNLEAITGDDAPPRICRLMAELEEAEHGDLARARQWLMRATGDAPPVPNAPAPHLFEPLVTGVQPAGGAQPARP